ncbi:MAG: glycoside hydrolase family 1 protein [Proteobacteria bacterium]|nr:glycoside hydrolase family 1 protein [Pseudomonadota bacterium]
MATIDLTRRTMLAGTAVGLTLSPGLVRAATKARRALPKGFLWGAATAGHQVEGDNINSDTWLFEQVKPTLFSEPSGSACDSYHRYGEDMDIARNIGFNCYRFGVEWARIEPARGEFSNAALDHYERMIDACHKRGLAPVLTYSHFTTPRWFAAMGGFEVGDSVDLFARFCERVTNAFGDRIALAATFNEPNVVYHIRSIPEFKMVAALAEAMKSAAARASGSDRFSSTVFTDPALFETNMIAAHKAGYQAIKAGPGDFPVGVTLAMTDEQGVGAGHLAAQMERERYDAWLKAAGESDFVGVQTYTRNLVGPSGNLPVPAASEKTQMGYEFYPPAVGGAIRYAARVSGKPVYVTENGVATEDDNRRIAYIDGALAEVRKCLDDGIDVRGYIHWSLLDNFEWNFGYRPKFGLVSVDRTTFKRTVKPSALHLGKYAKTNRI